MDINQCNLALYNCINSEIIETTSPITIAKAIKNEAEINGLKNCHIRDSIAIVLIKIIFNNLL